MRKSASRGTKNQVQELFIFFKLDVFPETMQENDTQRNTIRVHAVHNGEIYFIWKPYN